jgi:hypothetical protein
VQHTCNDAGLDRIIPLQAGKTWIELTPFAILAVSSMAGTGKAEEPTITGLRAQTLSAFA